MRLELLSTQSLSTQGTRGENGLGTTLSVIVPAYNEQYLIEASLNGLAVLGESPRLRQIKVIVVNDCSTDATAEAICRFREPIGIQPGLQEIHLDLAAAREKQGKGSGDSHRARVCGYAARGDS